MPDNLLTRGELKWVDYEIPWEVRVATTIEALAADLRTALKCISHDGGGSQYVEGVCARWQGTGFLEGK